jgi:exopolyphosphatase/guanosine-5'-triphosphate,3'-diphosphate pyrophosphatase
MRIAALDIVSNSFHLIVAHVNANGRIDILDRAKELVRLGEALRSGVITPDIFDRGLDALRALKRIADRHRPDALQAVATSAVREAQNGGEFVRAVRDELGIEVRVIRGQEEAHLIYLGARRALDLAGRRVAVFVVGGGSTELILADARECYFTVSLKLGVLRLRDNGNAPTLWGAKAAALADRIRSASAHCGARQGDGFRFVALTSGTAPWPDWPLRIAGVLGHPGPHVPRPLRRRKRPAHDGRARCWPVSIRAAPIPSFRARSCCAPTRAGGVDEATLW